MQPLNKQRGVALYLTFWIMSILLSIALGVSTVLITQLGILRGIGESVLAFAATDAGVEHVLFLDDSVCGSIQDIPDRITCLKGAAPTDPVLLSNGASYQLVVEAAGEGKCPSAGVNYCARSTGSYKDARRSVRIGR